MRKFIGLLAALALVFSFSMASAQDDPPVDIPEDGAAPAAPEMAPDPVPAPEAEPVPSAAPGATNGVATVAGTMEAGGSATFSIDSTTPDGGDGMTGFTLNVSPTFGYFYMDNLELRGGLLFTKGFGDLYEGSGMDVGLFVGAQYFMDLAGFKAYAGLDIGTNFYMPDEGDTMTSLLFRIPVGILYSLNQWVALDLGLTFQMSMGLSDGAPTAWTLPIGALGIRAFF